MFEAIILGLGAGLISSFITGPVFFAMIKTAIERGFKAGFSLAIGVFISDIILISIVLFGSQFFVYRENLDKYIGIIGGLFLLGVGIYYISSRISLNYQENSLVKISKRGYIIKGFLMCILTPSTFMFWVVVSGIISVKLNNLMYEKIICFIIALLTQLCIDAVKTFYAGKLRYRIHESHLKLLNKLAGIVIIAFAIWLILKTYLQFYS
ncbi:LysE family translocator [Pedobacter sp.]|uniref:LysE family translocator n=1 Tax=Pedobacter sp. TaxID=1411316 RepID=UPI00396CC561